MIIEAMGQGVPVITTPSSGTPITSGNDGMLVEARNPEALANRIEGPIEDLELLRQQIARAHSPGDAARYHVLESWACRLGEVFTSRDAPGHLLSH